MEVIEINEQEDGSALVTLELSRPEEEMLIGYAVVDILKKQIDEKKEKNK